MRDFSVSDIADAHKGDLSFMVRPRLKIRADEPTAQEIYKVIALIENRQNMTVAHHYLLSIANKKQLEQARQRG